jgi:tetratricopeptide (TPR) repeat protein
LLTALGQGRPALAALERAVAVFRRITATPDGLIAHGADLARTLQARAEPLTGEGRWEEALRDCQEALTLCDRLLAAGQAGLPDVRQLALHSQGCVLVRLARHEEAAASFGEEAATARRFLAAGTADARAQLAEALVCRGNAVNLLGRREEAVACYDEAVHWFRQVADPDRSGEVAAQGLADALARRAFFREHDPLPVRLRDLDEAIAIWRRLVEGQGRDELADEWAFALYAKGCTCCFAGQDEGDTALLAQGLDCYEQAVVLCRDLARDGPPLQAVDLAQLLWFRADAAIKLDRWPTALASFVEAVAADRQALDQGFPEAAAHIARTLSGLGRELYEAVWWRPGLWPDALPAFARALFEAAVACRSQGQPSANLEKLVNDFSWVLFGLPQHLRDQVLAALDGLDPGPVCALLTWPDTEWPPEQAEPFARQLLRRAEQLPESVAAAGLRDRARSILRRLTKDKGRRG